MCQDGRWERWNDRETEFGLKEVTINRTVTTHDLCPSCVKLNALLLPQIRGVRFGPKPKMGQIGTKKKILDYLLWKSGRFVQFSASLTHFEPESEIPVWAEYHVTVMSSSGMWNNLHTNLLRLAPNGTNLRLFFRRIFSHWNLILKSPKFVPFGANLTNFVLNSDTTKDVL